MIDFIQQLNPILAHGALGGYDEIIFVGVAAAFLVMMGISWFRSRNDEILDEGSLSEATSPEGNPKVAPNDAHIDLQ